MLSQRLVASNMRSSIVDETELVSAGAVIWASVRNRDSGGPGNERKGKDDREDNSTVLHCVPD